MYKLHVYSHSICVNSFTVRAHVKILYALFTNKATLHIYSIKKHAHSTRYCRHRPHLGTATICCAMQLQMMCAYKQHSCNGSTCGHFSWEVYAHHHAHASVYLYRGAEPTKIVRYTRQKTLSGSHFGHV